MKQTQTQQALCKNVFQNGDSEPSKEAVTQKWMEMINTIEHNKVATLGPGSRP